MMAKYVVVVNRSFSTEVSVEAETPEAAAEQVNSRDFPLPVLEEWSGNKDWIYTVYDEQGIEVHEVEA